MRLRKKKNLEEKVQLVANNLIGRECYAFYRVLDKAPYMPNYTKIFNHNKVEMEIGCGKGDFLLKKATDNKDINFIGVEMVLNVLVDALELVPKEVTNLKYLNINAQYLPYFVPENFIDKIYLNFSCPYPKKQYENHRLTNSKFLEIYKKICVPNFIIEQKTDNDNFFEYSLEEYKKSGFEILKISRDLHGEQTGFNEQKECQTQYEKKFISLGKNINYVMVRCKG